MPTLQDVRDRLRSALSERDYRRALEIAQWIQHLFPEDRETIALVGQIHLECERWAEARDLLLGLLDVDPESLVARSGLAIIAEAEGDLAGALEQFSRAFEIDPTNRQIASEIRRLNARASGLKADLGHSKHSLARRFLKEGMYEEAIDLFESALEVAPEPVVVALGMAESLWLAGRSDEAGDVAEEILASCPSCLKALAIEAAVLQRKGGPEAAALLEKAARFDPDRRVAGGIFEKAGLPLPPSMVETDLPDEDGLLEEETEEAPAEGDEGDDRQGEPFDLPEAEADGEWVREKAAEEGSAIPGEEGRQPLARARARQSEGLGETAVAECRAALLGDSSLAAEVRAVALAVAEASPSCSSARWLVVDAMVLEGQLRQAMEQYLMVLTAPSRSGPPAEVEGAESLEERDREQDGTNSGNREA